MAKSKTVTYGVYCLENDETHTKEILVQRLPLRSMKYCRISRHKILFVWHSGRKDFNWQFEVQYYGKQ